MRVGVIGVGSMGQNHARLYASMDCELAGVADPNREQGEAVARRYGTAYYSDYRELLGKVDAVSIVVPTSLHHRIAMDFLDQGVHCLVEKPIATTMEDTGEMIYLAKRNKAVLAVGHIENYNPAVRKLKQLLDDGLLGTVLTLVAKRVGPFVPRVRDVGIIIDSATHDIGVLNLLNGKKPTDVFAKVGTLRHEISDHGVIILDYDGVFASVEVNWFTPYKVRTLQVTGSEGMATLDYIEQTIEIHSRQQAYTVDVEKAEPLAIELQDFIGSITEGRPPVVDGAVARDILEIALGIPNPSR